jgi:hypothetical protein
MRLHLVPPLAGLLLLAACSTGAATLDRLPVGAYTLHLARIGYAGHTVPLEVPPGCAVVVEAYLRQTSTCLVRCPPAVPARAVITTCAGRDA